MTEGEECYEYISFCSGLTEEPEIVKTLKNNLIKKIVRACNSRILDYCVNKGDIKKNDVFNLLPETILFFLENDDVIGFYTQVHKYSIAAWYVVHDGVKYNTENYIHELNSIHISHDDPLYSNNGEWDHVVGHKIKKISIIDYDDGRHRRDFRDSFQKAVIFETDDGDMVISDLPGRGAVLPLINKSQIPKEILDNSKIIEL